MTASQAARDAITAAMAGVRRAVRLRNLPVAGDAVRGLGPVIEASGLARIVVSSRLLQAIEGGGLDGAPRDALGRWLDGLIDDPARSESAPEDNRPAAIRIMPGTFTAQVDAAEAALIDAGLNLYQQAGALVRVGYVSHGDDGDVLTVAPVDEAHLLELIGRVTVWVRHDARAKADVQTDCPRDVARAYLSRSSIEWRLPRLTGIVNAPTLRADGSVLDAPGYDDRTGLILDTGAASFPTIPDMPDQADAHEAADVLLELLHEFPFVDLQDDAVAVAAILTACIRRSLPAAPLFAFTAPAAGTGKSWLVDVVNTVATGRPAAALSWPDDQHEQRKQLDAALLAGSGVIALDNVTAELGGDRLNQMLTQPAVTVRVLGQSRNVEVPCGALMMANGNNLTIAADLTRRTLLCRLDAGMDRPELRTFQGDPAKLLRGNRGRYVAAALTILRAYHVAGRPAQPKPLGSFEAWSAWVRGAVVWCGFADPVESMSAAREADPRRSELSAVLEQWDAALGPRPVTSRQIIEAAMGAPDLREAFLAVAGVGGSINTQRLGFWLRANKGKMVGGLRIEATPPSRGVGRWAVTGGREAGACGVAELYPRLAELVS